MAEATDLHHSPLEDEHRALSAHLGPFAGWLLPIEYAGTLAEHRAGPGGGGAVRPDPPRQAEIEGPGAFDLLQRTMPNDLSKVPVGGAQYNMVLTEPAASSTTSSTTGSARTGTWWSPTPPTRRVDRPARAAAGDEWRSAGSTWALIAPQGPRSFESCRPLLPGAPRRSSTCAAARRGRRDERRRVPFGLHGGAGLRALRPRPSSPRRSGARCLAAGEDLGLQPSRARRPGHAPVGDGISAARQRHRAGSDPARSGPVVGGFLRQGGVRRAGGAPPAEGGGCPVAPVGTSDAGPPRSPARTTRSLPAGHGWGRRPAARSRRPSGRASPWHTRTAGPLPAGDQRGGRRPGTDAGGRRWFRPPFVASSPR